MNVLNRPWRPCSYVYVCILVRSQTHHFDVPVDFLFKPVLSHAALCILVAGCSCSLNSCYRGLSTSSQRLLKLNYRTAGKFGGQLNLAVWRLGKRPSNLNPSNLSAIFVYTYYFTRASAHILYVRNYRQI